jgi:hypothetical protein
MRRVSAHLIDRIIFQTPYSLICNTYQVLNPAVVPRIGGAPATPGARLGRMTTNFVNATPFSVTGGEVAIKRPAALWI